MIQPLQKPLEFSHAYGRKIAHQIIFPATATDYQAWHTAIDYLKQLGLNCGKLDYPGPTAFVQGKYNLPQKWSDLNAQQRATVAGIVSSRDPKNCEVNVYFFE